MNKYKRKLINFYAKKFYERAVPLNLYELPTDWISIFVL
jgi:hypothetical protein